MTLEPDFEIVYAVFNYYDGPLQGVADLNGQPHYYERLFNPGLDEYDNVYFLSPISHETFQLAFESWAIWRRWETAFHLQQTSRETHPALPADKARYDEIEKLLTPKLVLDPQNWVRLKGKFLPREDEAYSGVGMKPLQVKWQL